MNNAKEQAKTIFWRLCLSALLLAGQVAFAGELYRWVDENGKVHFGDRPPSGVEAENIDGKLRPINAADAPVSAKTSGLRESDVEQEYENRRRSRQREQRVRMLETCNAAKRKLRILEGPVALIGEDGKEIKMTERERRQMAAQLKSEINRACSSVQDG